VRRHPPAKEQDNASTDVRVLGFENVADVEA
jgi:hypothetical protein